MGRSDDISKSFLHTDQRCEDDIQGRLIFAYLLQLQAISVDKDKDLGEITLFLQATAHRSFTEVVVTLGFLI